jgi:uncharacterized membrane protein YdjX (TVP38/TMEM64 family)
MPALLGCLIPFMLFLVGAIAGGAIGGTTYGIWGGVAGLAVGGLAAFLVTREYGRERDRDLSE